MATYRVKTQDGWHKVEGTRFAYYIKNKQFWFFVHDAHDVIGAINVTHAKTGLRVTGKPEKPRPSGRGGIGRHA